jgi:hypothetical protein
MRNTIIESSRRRWPAITAVFMPALLFLCAFSSRGQSVSLGWNPGPPATTAGYYLYYGATSGKYSTRIDVGTNTVVTLSGLSPGQTEYFVVTAYSFARIESLPSNEASFVVPNLASGLAPQLSAVSPASAPPGAAIYIYGANLSTATRVQFAGANAPFSVSSDALLVATVPAASAGGPLAITTAHGVVTANFSVLPAPPPANDNFNNAQILTGAVAEASANTSGATKQPGEPNHAGSPGGHSVWYRWTAPAAGTWSLDTVDSSFTSLLAVYTGSALASLSPIASNLTLSGVYTNAITFTAAAGVTYQIAVDGLGGGAGNLALHLAPLPATNTIYATSFETSDGLISSLALAGQAGWQRQGTAASGLKNNLFAGLGQQGYIGFLSTTPAASTLLYPSLNYTMTTNTGQMIEFSVLMQINAPALSPYNSIFGWVVRNSSGRELFRVSFDDYTKSISYTLDDGNGSVYTGVGFNNTTIYNLAISMNFAQNLWSASLNGAPIVSGQPITTAGSALTLGDVDASEVFKSPSLPGTDGMIFDNYLVYASTGIVPAILSGPQNQTLSAGNGAFLGAVVSGAAPMGCQWYCNNNAIANATNSDLFLSGLTAGQSGNYSLVVTNAYGSASTAAILSVTNPPPKSLFIARVSLGGGGALLSLSVAPGNNYQFQASTNLRDWITLGTFFAMSTNALCFDSAAAATGCRFYRLVSP